MRFLSVKKQYVREILKKFSLEDCKKANTPMNQKAKLSKDDEADAVNQKESLIGCLMYLITTRRDILYAMNDKKQEIVTQSRRG